MAARGARAQQPPVPVVGFLRSATLTDAAHLVTAFRQGLKEAGFVEGQNISVEYRSAEGRPDRLPAIVADLVRRPVAVIVTNLEGALPAKAATKTVPIVFATGADPLIKGLVNSLNRKFPVHSKSPNDRVWPTGDVKQCLSLIVERCGAGLAHLRLFVKGQA